MKYRSQWSTFILRSSIKSYWLISHSYHVYTSNSLQDIRQNHWTMKYRSQRPTFIFRCSIKSYWLISPRYLVSTSNSLQNIRQIHWTMKYRSQWPIFLSQTSTYWLISHIIMFTHQIAFKIWGKITEPWNIGHKDPLLFEVKHQVILITPRYHVYTSNSLQDIRQNHWTIKYRSQWPTFILKSSFKSYRLIIPKFHVYTSNSLQAIGQNHRTMK